jgi:hypothetical protein
MPFKSLVALAALLLCATIAAQDAPSPQDDIQKPKDVWSWSHKVEIRADYRWSDNEKHPLKFLPSPAFPEPGDTVIFEATPDPGHHVELNVADVQFDVDYGDWIAARAKVHFQALHRRNPTSADRKIDADELYVRFGPKPEFLERPEHTSFFLQAGKFPKMERQPTRLLESYGLAATSFNRFEDIQLLAGGTVGRNLYWRVQAANGNPLFFRDPNALAGDNGTEDRRPPNPDPRIKSGFPILYNAEVEGLFFDASHVQMGEALGYRWQNATETMGFDAIVFHYRRELAERAKLTGTFYGGDIDLLNGPFDLPGGLPIHGNRKEEYGSRVYAEWGNATAIAQFTKQNVAGLQREGSEFEIGYRIPFAYGPFEYLQPAGRASALKSRFIGNPVLYPAPSIWWPWKKYDAGVRVGLKKGLDVTLEYTDHSVKSAKKINLKEALVTVRWRV